MLDTEVIASHQDQELYAFDHLRDQALCGAFSPIREAAEARRTSTEGQLGFK